MQNLKINRARPVNGPSPKVTDGWFPVQDLKINRARPVKRADGEHRPLQMVFMFVARGGWAAIFWPVGDAASCRNDSFVYLQFLIANS